MLQVWRMASIFSHPAVPLGIAMALGRKRVPPSLLAAGAVCSILPDVDVLAFRFGIPYGALFGHRGFTHSIFFALFVGVYCAMWRRPEGVGARATFWFLFAATASHGLLDALTNGGLGVGFFAPFVSQRYFLPWDVIEVSPIGIGFFSRAGGMVIQSELLWVWLPCMAVGLLGYGLRLWARGVTGMQPQE